MSLSPTIPNLYKYGFLTSRAVGVLSRRSAGAISEEERQVLSECKELVEKIVRGKDFIIGPNPEGVRNLRPEDVETFTYVLETDAEVKKRATDEERLRIYFQGILDALDSMIGTPAKPVEDAAFRSTVEFLGRIADALIETARRNLRPAPKERTVQAVHE